MRTTPSNASRLLSICTRSYVFCSTKCLRAWLLVAVDLLEELRESTAAKGESDKANPDLHGYGVDSGDFPVRAHDNHSWNPTGHSSEMPY